MLQIIKGILDLVYPPICAVCGADWDDGPLCTSCTSQFQPICPPYCDRCGEPITLGDRHVLCYRCQTGPSPTYDWSEAAYQYDGALLSAIHRLKYDGRKSLAKPLGHLLALSLSNDSHLFDPPSGKTDQPRSYSFDLVIPVPLHPGRYRTRGFNQAEELAWEVATHHGWPMVTSSLARVRRTPSQTALSHNQRAHNMAGAFVVTDPDALEMRSVLLVDDVLTSTSTVREASRAVMEAGAARVCVLALARSV